MKLVKGKTVIEKYVQTGETVIIQCLYKSRKGFMHPAYLVIEKSDLK